MEKYVVDTHPLLWYVTDGNRLSFKANLLLERAEAGEIDISVPAIVLIEAIDVLNKGRIVYNVDDLLQLIYQTPQFIIKNLDIDIINLYRNYFPSLPNTKLDGHDKIVVVTAQFFNNLPIITKDPDIQKVHPTIW